MSGNGSSSTHLGEKTAMFLKRGTPSFLPCIHSHPSDLNSVSSKTTKWVTLILTETKQHQVKALERNIAESAAARKAGWLRSIHADQSGGLEPPSPFFL